MRLTTKAIEKKLPSLTTTENQDMEELIAIEQFFHPLLPWRWYVFGGNKINQDDYKFYGMVFSPDCPNGELGYFTLSELQEIEALLNEEFKPTPATNLTL